MANSIIHAQVPKYDSLIWTREAPVWDENILAASYALGNFGQKKVKCFSFGIPNIYQVWLL
jgi:hypothetical protein